MPHLHAREAAKSPTSPASPSHRRPRIAGVSLRMAILSAVLLSTLPTGTATAASTQINRADSHQEALDRTWSVGAYGATWRGAYNGIGSGAILRWRMWPGSLGVEVFGSRASIDWPDSEREDYVGGFAITTPFRLHHRVEAKLGAGFCGMISRIDPVFFGGPRNDTVLLGVQAGASLHWAASDWVSLFVAMRGFVYHGVDRRRIGTIAQGELQLQPALQGNAGLSFHFGS